MKYRGVDACPAIHSAYLAVPSSGAIIDASAIAQTGLDLDCTINKTANPFAGIDGPPFVLELGALVKTAYTWNIQSSNQVIQCTHQSAGIDFEPVDSGPGLHDRAIIFDWNEPVVPAEQAITGNIRLGDRSFTSTQRPIGVTPGSWLHIYTRDSVLADSIYFDVAQVASVSGNTVNLVRPFRMSFPQTEGPAPNLRTFYNALSAKNPASNSGIVGCLVESNQRHTRVPGIDIQHMRNGFAYNNVLKIANGQPLYTFRSVGAKFENNRIIGGAAEVTEAEFAESVDTEIKGLECFAEGTNPAVGCQVTLDFGLGFFRVSNISLDSGVNGSFGMLYGAHDGIVSNLFGNRNTTTSVGMLSIGSYNVTLLGSRFSGLDSTGTGIQFSDYTDAATTITSTGNVIWGNTVNGFAAPYLVKNAGDLVVYDDSLGNLSTNHSFSVGGGSPLLSTNQSGTGSLCMTKDCALTSPSLTMPRIGGGTQLTKYYVISAAISPAATPPGTCAEQIFSPLAFASLIKSGDNISLTSSGTMAADGVYPTLGVRALDGGIAITYCNSSSKTLVAPPVTVNVMGIR